MHWILSLCLVLNIWRSNANKFNHHISHRGIRSANGLSPGDFGDELFKKYGNNAGHIGMVKFGNLLKNLGIGENMTKNIGSVENNCFSGPSLLRIFSLNATSIDKASFQTVCPAIVQQIDSKACKDDHESKKPVEAKESKSKAWGYGFLSVGIISAASLLGAFVVPFMSHTFYKKLLLFMVSLAVGVLGGSGIFHLLPNTFGLADSSDVSFLYKSAVVVGGIYFFFLLEYTMKLYIRHKEGIVSEGNGHGHSHGLKSMQNGKSEIPGQGIAVAQLELYKYKGDPKHDHTSGGLIIDSKLNRKPDANVISGVCSQTTTFSNSVSEESITIKEPNKEEHNKEKQHIAPVAWMIVIGDAVHNFIDGLAIGAAYSTSVYSGLSTALAIFCEELPHELGDFAVLLNGGMTYKQAMCFNFFSACSCFLGLVIGLLLGYSTSAVKWIYALAGGMFLYISLVDMLQEATEMSFKEGAGSLGKSIKMFALQGFGMLFGFAVMFILAMYQNNISI
ncbi:zinc transporter ZIP14 isoform X3 [Exaiptasia diaphana]|uniref:Zinc transporter ZIP14 n=1 Tax=Exaiptasia diaphana TaxID=2652724 RepID=A0A913YWV8_EXADI|nr:zinc transporter ZIP14 isoform X3 [Exaiptasia diaphana]